MCHLIGRRPLSTLSSVTYSIGTTKSASPWNKSSPLVLWVIWWASQLWMWRSPLAGHEEFSCSLHSITFEPRVFSILVYTPLLARCLESVGDQWMAVRWVNYKSRVVILCLKQEGIMSSWNREQREMSSFWLHSTSLMSWMYHDLWEWKAMQQSSFPLPIKVANCMVFSLQFSPEWYVWLWITRVTVLCLWHPRVSGALKNTSMYKCEL